VTFIQPSSKLLTIELKCPIVKIIQTSSPIDETCFPEQDFHLTSSNSLNNISSFSPVLLLPYNLEHNLQPIITTKCSNEDFIYSFYLLSIDPSQWKYSRLQRYSNPLFQDTFIENYCSDFQSKSTFTIKPKSLSHGYYTSIFTISSNTNHADYRQFVQPMEIIRSDLITPFGGNQTLTNEGDEILLDFYSTTFDPDTNELDRRKFNFTLLCYPQNLQSSIFHSNIYQLDSSRPTENNPQNVNHWSIPYTDLNLIFHRSELNLQFYEKQCFSSNEQGIQFDLNTKILKIKEQNLVFNNDTLYFLLIIRHLVDGRQLIRRLEVDKKLNDDFNTTDLDALEGLLANLDDLALSNPKKAVEIITNLADKLNEMSDNSVS
jgi:hypothetical protein